MVAADKMAAQLRHAFDAEYGKSEDYVLSNAADKEMKELAMRNATWDWKFGYMGNFDITMSRRFTWGSFELHLKLEDARIADAAVYSDAMDTDYIASLPSYIKGKTFCADEMDSAIMSAAADPGQKAMAEDISAFIKERTV